MTTYADVVAGLHSRFATVEGIADPAKQILDYEPEDVAIFPTVYSLFDSLTRERAGGITRSEYRTLHRVVFKWKSTQAAERAVIAFVDALGDAVEELPDLGIPADALTYQPYAQIGEGQGVFVRLGQNLYRGIDFFSTTVVKRASRGLPT